MSKGIGSGDKLARGAVKATYSTTEGGVTQDSWDKMFEDFDPKKFAEEGLPKVEGEKETSANREFGKS